MTGHKHAALMLQYAQDAAETTTPWDRWENRNPDIGLCHYWGALTHHPEWNPALEYRRKPRTLPIGEVDVPEPMRTAPAMGSLYYSPHPMSSTRFASQLWQGDEWDIRLLSDGLVYPDEASAVTCARALLTLLEPRK